jgi:hypothetical protein
MKNTAIVIPLRVIFLFILTLSENPVFSQSYNNVTIGAKYSGPKTVETTLGGYSGTLTIGSLNDGTVYSFHFISNNIINNRSEIPFFIAEADKFLKETNKKYDISLDCKYWKHKEFSKGNWYDVATCSKDSTSFLVTFSIDLNENNSTILLNITNEVLSNKGANEHLINNIREP